jgi:hypothetical protein
MTTIVLTRPAYRLQGAGGAYAISGAPARLKIAPSRPVEIDNDFLLTAS